MPNSMRQTPVLNSRSPRIALLSLIMGAVLISFSGVWVKVAHVAPNVSAFYRVLFGGGVLFFAALYRRELKWRGARQFMLSTLCGFILALDLWLYHYSIEYIGPGLGTILANFEVLILAAVGILFLREQLRLLFLISLPLAFVGLILIVGLKWSHLEQVYRIGIFYGLVCAVCYSAFILMLRKLQSEQTGASFFYVLMLVSFTTAIFLAAEVVYSNDSFRIPDLQSLLSLAALGVFSQSVGWILIANALPGVRVSLSGLILLLQPALAFVWDVLFFQRPTAIVNWLGVLIALAAIYLGMARQQSAGR